MPPEKEASMVEKTVAMILFHRNYMASVFKADKYIAKCTGVDKRETIQFMSGYCDRKIAS